MKATVVLDIGKTNAKLALLDANGKILAEQRCPNTIAGDEPYPHYDTELIWEWLLVTLHAFSQQADIAAIVPVTHGAAAALVDDDGLVLPVLDYESTLPQTLDRQYQALRPPFAETFSPDLPAGLNLGRQLYWLAQSFPAEFGRARHILTYPQYWAWRLSGIAASEITSLGCHTDLWQPLQEKYSTLVERMGWQNLFPPRQPSWTALGPLRRELLARTGLANCQILCGIHDSNASLLRYLGTMPGNKPHTVLSTGTWVIAAAFGAPLDRLDEQLDMLANVNVLGQPVACMRFMGGREFATLAGPEPKRCSPADLQRLIGQATLALPCFSESGGPFFGQVGTISGPVPQTTEERYALATLYCVLMTDYCLTALESTGPVVVEGSFTDNPYFSGLLAALRKPQTISFSDDASGTTCGGWMLHYWGSTSAIRSEPATLMEPAGWEAYRDRWLALLRLR
ncbi:MAG: L-fuculose kinase [Collimonas fungivorans]|uniref:FGGY-family carbohydrate kinase n=1 Tax=Collimonas fungivorans TaxID=158899 RepID=UPI0026ED8CC6|nr:FGGY family carbohydrate kinase [Collimonas fungivorans]MDB5767709.1 L-fuculose kinase [Collimonas fungivorans]